MLVKDENILHIANLENPCVLITFQSLHKINNGVWTFFLLKKLHAIMFDENIPMIEFFEKWRKLLTN